jgi:hypothetical protein
MTSLLFVDSFISDNVYSVDGPSSSKLRGHCRTFDLFIGRIFVFEVTSRKPFEILAVMKRGG